MQPPLGGLDPRLEPVTLPSVRLHLHEHDPCCAVASEQRLIAAVAA